MAAMPGWPRRRAPRRRRGGCQVARQAAPTDTLPGEIVRRLRPCSAAGQLAVRKAGVSSSCVSRGASGASATSIGRTASRKRRESSDGGTFGNTIPSREVADCRGRATRAGRVQPAHAQREQQPHEWRNWRTTRLSGRRQQQTTKRDTHACRFERIAANFA
ncbi:hypothetical protein Ctob_003349 [Chrysochromulina tobinii]|uniref:Uncharacterized protein n=1 Tax=Chrysochromulina tobinii TaxID=1460289 RepID=A0A0M0J8C6_9EUKA|nr:hypothetical protein Ctob_003349 [Chrysochromulina tobinii]|eukprot:KOO22592.1 hypothetical protein Ctob_003349 [Chrysochromulina sp. CCMP291]